MGRSLAIHPCLPPWTYTKYKEVVSVSYEEANDFYGQYGQYGQRKIEETFKAFYEEHSV